MCCPRDNFRRRAWFHRNRALRVLGQKPCCERRTEWRFSNSHEERNNENKKDSQWQGDQGESRKRSFVERSQDANREVVVATQCSETRHSCEDPDLQG